MPSARNCNINSHQNERKYNKIIRCVQTYDWWYKCVHACAHLRCGLYMKSRLSSLCPASDSQMNLFFRLLYGCFFKLYWPTRGSLEKPWGAHKYETSAATSSRCIYLSPFSMLTGQMFSLGVPSSCTIRSTCWISEVPGSRGLWASSSARMHPTALRGKTSQIPPLKVTELFLLS